MSRREFANLQKEWYDKLSESGFEDIEWVDHKTGIGHGSTWLKTQTSHNRAITYNPDTEEYFRLARSFYQHGKFKNSPRS